MGLVTTYQTFMAIAIEGESTTSPYRDGSIGAISAEGVTSAPTISLPLAGQETLMSNPNYVDLPLPEGQNLTTSKRQSIASRVEGSVSVNVPPGLMPTIKSWAFDRSWASSTQCVSATIWVAVSNRCKRFIGCKVNTADFVNQVGQPLTVTFNVFGYGEESVSTPSFTAPSWWHHAVYASDTASLSIGNDTGSVAAVNNIDAINFTINNMIDDTPHRIWSSNYPRRMYNRNRDVTGSFSRDYLDDTEYARFLAGNTAAVQTVLSKTISAVTYTHTIVFPRAQYNGVGGVNAAGQKDILVKENMDFKALCGRVGTDATLAEMTWT